MGAADGSKGKSPAGVLKTVTVKYGVTARASRRAGPPLRRNGAVGRKACEIPGGGPGLRLQT